MRPSMQPKVLRAKPTVLSRGGPVRAFPTARAALGSRPPVAVAVAVRATLAPAAVARATLCCAAATVTVTVTGGTQVDCGAVRATRIGWGKATRGCAAAPRRGTAREVARGLAGGAWTANPRRIALARRTVALNATRAVAAPASGPLTGTARLTAVPRFGVELDWTIGGTGVKAVSCAAAAAPAFGAAVSRNGSGTMTVAAAVSEMMGAATERSGAHATPI